MSPTHQSVTIVIPTHNRIEKLLRLLQSIEDLNYPKEKLEIIVIDDASNSETFHKLTIYQKSNKNLFRNIKIIRNEQEKFSTKSINEGIRDSEGEYVLVTADDTILSENCIREMINAFKSANDIFIVSPIVLYWENKDKIWFGGGRLWRPLFIPWILFFNKTLHSSCIPTVFETDFFTTTYMLKRDFIEIVGFHDEMNFPHNWMEIEYSLRIRHKGLKLVMASNAKVYHDITATKVNRLITRGDNAFKVYDQARSRIVIRRLYGSRLEILVFLFLLFPLSSLFYFCYFLKKRNFFNLLRCYIRGTVDGFLQKI